MAVSGCYTVLDNSHIGQDTSLLRLDAGDIVREARPGQFVMVSCSSEGSTDPLLRRPMSIMDANPASGSVSIMYQIVGRGTEHLSRVRAGERLKVLGPLGSWFSLPEPDSNALMIAGGFGVAPLYFLSRLSRSLGSKTIAVIGARSAQHIRLLDEFRQVSDEVRAATDDGSRGFHGSSVDAAEELILSMRAAHTPVGRVYACGPNPMLAAVKSLCSKHAIRCQLSLESRMACGVGACLGCIQRTGEGSDREYVRTCVEGPVFDSDAVSLDPA